MQIRIKPEKTSLLLGIFAIALIVLSTAGYAARFAFGYTSRLISAFYLGWEGNFPTYFQSISLLFCAGLLALIAAASIRKRDKYAYHWAFLSILFIFLSMDEMLGIHEELIVPLRSLLHTRGILHYAWVVPYGILLVVILLVYARFTIDLPKKIRLLFISAGATYVTGALFVEMLGGRFYELYGEHNITYEIYQTVEESLEMCGIVIFVYALLSFMRFSFKHLSLVFDEAPSSVLFDLRGGPEGATCPLIGHLDDQKVESQPGLDSRSRS